jgi:hypothetical protein
MPMVADDLLPTLPVKLRFTLRKLVDWLLRAPAVLIRETKTPKV